jgi:hypothetical protein
MKLKAKILAVILLLSTLLFSACLGSASSGGSVGSMVLEAPYKLIKARIVGQVTHDSEGLPSVEISVRNSEISVMTDKNGRFQLDYDGMTNLGVTILRIHLIAKADGYRTRTKGLMIEENGTTEIEIKLLPQKDQ